MSLRRTEKNILVLKGLILHLSSVPFSELLNSILMLQMLQIALKRDKTEISNILVAATVDGIFWCMKSH